jgi:hypothetical protein
MWGVLFLFFTFRVQGLDLLPDFVGYVLFLIGLSALASEHESFRIAQLLCIPLLILSLFEVYQPPYPQPTGHSGLGTAIGIIDWILSFLLIYHICKGIQDLANDQGLYSLADTAQSRWRMFVVYQVLVAFMMLLGATGFASPVLFLLFIIVIVFGIVLLVLFMQLMSRCAEEL